MIKSIFFILMSFLVSNSICYAQTFPSNSPETAEIPSIEEKERIQFFESLSEEDALKVDKLLDYIHLSRKTNQMDKERFIFDWKAKIIEKAEEVIEAH